MGDGVGKLGQGSRDWFPRRWR